MALMTGASTPPAAPRVGGWIGSAADYQRSTSAPPAGQIGAGLAAAAPAGPGAPVDEVEPQAHPLSARQSAISWATTLVVIAVAWIRPTGPMYATGLNVAIWVLLAVCSALCLVRNLPTRMLPRRLATPALIAWGLAAAALLSVDSQSGAPAFAFMAAGHAGYRLSNRFAGIYAAGMAALSAVGLAVAGHAGLAGWPWIIGLTTGLPVLLGMNNRSQEIAVAARLSAFAAAARAAESEARAQSLAERAGISRDVHDVLAHSLSGINMQLELGEMLLERGDVELGRAALGKARSLVKDGMAEARRAVQDARAPVLPLPQTLSSMFAGAADVHVGGTERALPVAVTATVVRAAQESLTNARRHALGAPLSVQLRYRRDDVRLDVVNGAGQRAAGAGEGSGMGLVGMRERVALVGGTVAAGPEAEGPYAGGWRVTVVLPAGDGALGVLATPADRTIAEVGG